MGRKSLYEDKVKPYIEDIKKMIAVTTEKDIAENVLGISQQTFENYKKQYPELKEALQGGTPKTIIDLKLAILQRAVGFRDAITDKYYPPDVQAANLLLKNIDPDWRADDKTTIDLKKEKLQIEKDKGIIW